MHDLSHAQYVTTVAGGGSTGLGDGGPATAAQVNDPHGGIFDKSGNLFFVEAQGHRIRKIGIDGNISTVAGNGLGAYNGDNIPATTAKIYLPNSIAFDTSGNLLITDAGNYRLRKVDMQTGVITTIAGTGVQGYNGDGIPATAAQINSAWGIVVDAQNNIYFSDGLNYRIRKISSSGVISTVCGTGTMGFTSDGGMATSATISAVLGLAFDPIGNLYFADYNENNRIRKIGTDGKVITVAGAGSGVYNGENLAALTAQIDPMDIRIDNSGRIYFVDFQNSRIRRVNSDGKISTVAGTGLNGYNGDGIPATDAKIHYPGGLAIDSCGNIFFGDIGNHRIRKIAFNPDCVPMAVNEPMQPAVQGLRMQPNPTTGLVTVTAGVHIKSVAIYNLLGQVVVQHAGSGKPQQQADVSTLPPGMYIVRVNEVWTARLVKE
jgi:trimeric autotransporter adhesin